MWCSPIVRVRRTRSCVGQAGSRVERVGEGVFHLRARSDGNAVGYDTIADRLNQDLVKYPPPEPPGKSRARGAWGKSSVYEILANPKYTGYQVFNKRASRSRHGKVNDPMFWGWSPEPVDHDARHWR